MPIPIYSSPEQTAVSTSQDDVPEMTIGAAPGVGDTSRVRPQDEAPGLYRFRSRPSFIGPLTSQESTAPDNGQLAVAEAMANIRIGGYVAIESLREGDLLVRFDEPENITRGTTPMMSAIGNPGRRAQPLGQLSFGGLASEGISFGFSRRERRGGLSNINQPEFRGGIAGNLAAGNAASGAVTVAAENAAAYAQLAAFLTSTLAVLRTTTAMDTEVEKLRDIRFANRLEAKLTELGDMDPSSRPTAAFIASVLDVLPEVFEERGAIDAMRLESERIEQQSSAASYLAPWDGN